MRASTGVSLALRAYCTRIVGEDPNASHHQLYQRACRECHTVLEQNVLATLDWLQRSSNDIVSDIFLRIEKNTESVVTGGHNKLTHDDVIDIIVDHLHDDGLYGCVSREETNTIFRSRILPELKTLKLEFTNLKKPKSQDEDAANIFYEDAGGKCMRA